MQMQQLGSAVNQRRRDHNCHSLRGNSVCAEKVFHSLRPQSRGTHTIFGDGCHHSSPTTLCYCSQRFRKSLKRRLSTSLTSFGPLPCCTFGSVVRSSIKSNLGPRYSLLLSFSKVQQITICLCALRLITYLSVDC